MAKTTVDLPAGLHRTLRLKAAVESRSMSEIIVTALEAHLHTFHVEQSVLDKESIPRDRSVEPPLSKEH